MSPSGAARPLAWFWGDDVLGFRRAIDRLAHELGEPDVPLETWTADAPGIPAPLDELALRVGTAPLFGGGLLAVVHEPMTLLRARAEQERVIGLLEQVAPGNALAFTEITSSGAREPSASLAPVRRAIGEAGGTVAQVAAPKPGQLEPWIMDRAAELGLHMDRDAVRLLAERVGGGVREGDVDRRRLTEVVDGELRLLALYRPDAPVRRADVDALVAAAVPASAWAFLDAVADRRVRDATAGADRLLAEGTALPVVVTQLHHRLRQLLEIRDRVATGESPRELVRIMRLNPYRAEVLVRQARAWESTDLESALEGLLEVDLASKGLAPAGGRSASGMTGPLALALWIAEHVATQ